jgi:hypothetical protein
MKQGRKSRYTTMAALRRVLTVLAAIALIAPAAALGQAAAGEYDDVKLPQAGDKYEIPSGDDQSATGAVVPSQGGGGPSSGAGSSSGGGDATILLIALAVVAAGCVGVAAWRLRRGGSGADRGPDSPAPPITQGNTGESRTL